ncbi:MAG: hypothetical protein EON55_04955 [Alphaproteobacteria bacterium]|nr:MAG: hypothetical protein EON55_04955 [Alphaproteobacteria bacterium]
MSGRAKTVSGVPVVISRAISSMEASSIASEKAAARRFPKRPIHGCRDRSGGAQGDPEPRATQGCVHHSDRGAQYASEVYRELLAVYGLVGSMSRRGNPYNNAKAESFMTVLKVEAAYLAA